MNNIAAYRKALGLTQGEVTAALREYDRRIDNSMVSRFENELCYPTPLVMRCLCNLFNCVPEELYGVTEQQYIEEIIQANAPAEPESFDVTELINCLGYGRRKAVSRAELSFLLDKSDREVRKLVEEARNCGYVIISLGTHGGYYLTNNVDEIHAYYLQEQARATSILRRLRKPRQILREAGRSV